MVCQPGEQWVVYRRLAPLRRWLAPSVCALCGAPGCRDWSALRVDLDLCEPCVCSMPVIHHPCPRCGVSREVSTDPLSPCAVCLAAPPAFDGCFVPFRYRFPLDYLIRGLKFEARLAWGRALGTLFAVHRAAWMDDRPACIIPVPLHADRRRARGFNQCEELAGPVSRLLGVPVEARWCYRARATREQTHLGAADRRRNVSNAFAVTGRAPARRVALLDDVMTTGSTVEAVARALKNAGVERVEVWAIARAASR